MTENQAIIKREEKVREAILHCCHKEYPCEDGLNQLISALAPEEQDALIRTSLDRFVRRELFKPYQAELIKMQAHLQKTGKKVLVLCDGRDASGKGGAIRRMTRHMNQKYYRTVTPGKPSKKQQTEFHMKRYIEQFPHAGETIIFDRSWYNRALVEPVLGFCNKRQYRDFMRKVNDYEESFVSDGKTTLIKIYFSVSQAEQARRFERRRLDPLRQWKLSEVDLQAQDLWDEFTRFKYKTLNKTHTRLNPWHIIRSDDKFPAQLETIKLILRRVKFHGRCRNLDLSPAPDIVIPGHIELKRLKKELKRAAGKGEGA
ncbi:MAG: polyphosphate kinase 2 [Gammaproteobacteria bacterium]|nr:polyphosphate kinase 2 [Gammaproteobacteria bacterium]